MKSAKNPRGSLCTSASRTAPLRSTIITFGLGKFVDARAMLLPTSVPQVALLTP
jgi:hypothetical protein